MFKSMLLKQGDAVMQDVLAAGTQGVRQVPRAGCQYLRAALFQPGQDEIPQAALAVIRVDLTPQVGDVFRLADRRGEDPTQGCYLALGRDSEQCICLDIRGGVIEIALDIFERINRAALINRLDVQQQAVDRPGVLAPGGPPGEGG